jgi:Protein of unknown function (DUF2569)
MDDEIGLTPRQKAFLEEIPEAEMAPTPSELKGVGGALGFLVAILVFLSPLLSTIMTFVQQQEAADFYPELVDGDLWQSAMILDWSMVVLSTILSVLAGILLIKRFKRSTVFVVILLIWFSAVGVGIMSLILGDYILPGSSSGSAAGASLGRPIAFSLVWTLYLLISRRVRNTYPREV